MPRAKSIVMDKHDPKKLHSAAITRMIKLHRPYEVIAGELAGEDPDCYAIVYTAPLGGDRKVMATREVRANATALRDMLSEAWAEGHWASGRN